MKKKAALLLLAVPMIILACGGGSTKGNVKNNNNAKNDMWGEATGMAMIYDNDSTLARDRAIDDAMNKLVKMKLGTMISGRSLVEDYQLIENIVEAKSTGMVRNWKVTAEGAREGSVYEVTLQGEVYPAAVDETIEATLRNYGRPKFMVLVEEDMEGKINAPGNTIAETAVKDLLGNSGFEFVDPAMTKEIIAKDRDKMAKALKGQIGGDVQSLLLDDAGAEVLILGSVKIADQTATVLKYAPNSTMKSKNAIVNIRAVDVYTGNILTAKSADASGAAINDEKAAKIAIENAMKKLMGSIDENGKFKSGPFINTMSRKFLEASTRRKITINIAGLDYTEFSKLKDAIKGRIRGVGSVETRGQSGKYSKIEIEFAGKTTDFADELVAKGANFGFKITVEEIFPNKIMITAQKIK